MTVDSGDVESPALPAKRQQHCGGQLANKSSTMGQKVAKGLSGDTHLAIAKTTDQLVLSTRSALDFASWQ